MIRQLITTADGSHTLYVPALNENYHSRKGAVTESEQVYIQTGLLPLLGLHTPLRILEVGFGTGLNAWLTEQQATVKRTAVYYYTVEPFPLTIPQAQPLNYAASRQDEFMQLHTAPWETDVPVTPAFTLHKVQMPLHAVQLQQSFFHLIYFDAFAPDVQPELWTQSIFENLYACLVKDGILVTYSSKGSVRRAMQAVGFTVEKLTRPTRKKGNHQG